jgi:hypothetical protein
MRAFKTIQKFTHVCSLLTSVMSTLNVKKVASEPFSFKKTATIIIQVKHRCELFSHIEGRMRSLCVGMFWQMVDG